MEIRRSYDHLISTMGFPITVRCHLYIESGPWCWDQNIPVWLVQHHGCWCLGVLHLEVICNHGIAQCTIMSMLIFHTQKSIWIFKRNVKPHICHNIWLLVKFILKEGWTCINVNVNFVPADLLIRWGTGASACMILTLLAWNTVEPLI